MQVNASEEDIIVMRQAIMDKFTVHHANYNEGLADVYDKHLDEPILDSALAFYTSEAGEMLLSKIPKIAAESDQLSYKLGKAVLNDMVNIGEEYDTE